MTLLKSSPFTAVNMGAFNRLEPLGVLGSSRRAEAFFSGLKEEMDHSHFFRN